MSESGVLARGALVVTGSRVLGLLATLLQIKLTVTHLGADGYGILMTAVLFVNLAAAWSELGVGAVVVRRVAREGADLQHQIGLSLGISSWLVLPLALGANLVAHLLYRDQPKVLLGIAVLSLGLMATTWATCYQPIAQVRSKFGYLTAMDLLGRPVSLALVFLATRIDGGIAWFFAAQLVIPFIQLATMLALARASGGFRPIWNRSQCLRLLREALPLTYIALIGAVYFNIDGILLSLLSTTEAVGAYGFAYRTVWHVTIVSVALAGVMMARLSRDSVNPPVWRRTTATSIRAIMIVGLPVAVLMAPFAHDIVRLVGSESMAQVATEPLILLAIAVCISMISGVASTAVIARGQQGILTKLNTVNLIFNIALNVAMIPVWGAEGAARALVITEATGMLIVLWVIFHDEPRAFPWRSLRLIVPLVAAHLVASFMPGGFALRFTTTVVVYLILVLLVQVVGLNEIRALRGGRDDAEVSVEEAR